MAAMVVMHHGLLLVLLAGRLAGAAAAAWLISPTRLASVSGSASERSVDVVATNLLVGKVVYWRHSGAQGKGAADTRSAKRNPVVLDTTCRQLSSHLNFIKILSLFYHAVPSPLRASPKAEVLVSAILPEWIAPALVLDFRAARRRLPSVPGVPD